MGKIIQGISGGFSGKVGAVVGCRRKSKYYMRSQSARVSNPRTPGQQQQRGKFAVAFGFLRVIKSFIRIGYREFAEDKSAFNAAMSYMLKKAITGNGTDIGIDFNRVLVSSGSLMPVLEGSATASIGQMTFRWKDNSGMGNAEAADIVMLLVYDKNKEAAVFSTEAGLRTDGHGELALPDEWQGDELAAYLSFRSADGSSVANSVCVGNCIYADKQ